MKLAYLKKKYPSPEKIKAVSRAQQLAYKALLWSAIAIDLQDVNRTRDSAVALLKALELTPDDKKIARSAATMFIWLNEYKQALEIIKTASTDEEKDPSLLRTEALALHFSKKYRTALKRVDEAIKI